MTDTTQPPAETLAIENAAKYVLDNSRRGSASLNSEQFAADTEKLMAAYRDIIGKALASGHLAALTRPAGGDAIPAGEDGELRDAARALLDAFTGPDPCGRMKASVHETDTIRLDRALDASPKPPAGGDAGASHTPNAYVLLEPDAEDVRLLAKGALAGCPCCEGTPSTFARLFPHSGIYQAYVNCSRCHVQVLSNARDRTEAREQAIAAWSKRPVSAGGDAIPAGEVGQDQEAILAAYRHLKKVGDRLCVCAETTGGVAGPDEGLQKAIQDWGNCRRLLRDVRAAASEPDCPIAAGQSRSSDTPKPPAGGDAGAVERVAISQNDAMRQQLAHVGNLVSDLARAMKVDQANDDGTWPDLAGRIQRLIAAALAPPAPVVEGDRWLHVKRGTVYEVIGYAELQNGNVKGLREGAELAVYRGEDGKLWARERGVFHDGRFAALSEGRSHG